MRRGLFGAAGPGRDRGPRRLSDVVVRPLNFAVRRQRMKLIVALRVSGTLNA